MKTTKVLLITVLMAFAAVTFAQSESPQFLTKKPPPVLSTEISISSAMQNPGLLAAMNAQVDPSILESNARIYTVPIKYRKVVYFVSGTRGQWMKFFGIIIHNEDER